MRYLVSNLSIETSAVLVYDCVSGTAVLCNCVLRLLGISRFRVARDSIPCEADWGCSARSASQFLLRTGWRKTRRDATQRRFRYN